MSDPASERPVAPDLTDAPIFDNWAVFDDRERMFLFGLPRGLGIDPTGTELAAIDMEGGWARDVNGVVIRLGIRMPKTDRSLTFEQHFGPDFRRQLLTGFGEADKR